MTILARSRFRTSKYHRQIRPSATASEMAQGPILDVQLEFETWLGGQSLAAEAFLDPGADSSIVSMRWIRERAAASRRPSTRPKIDPAGQIIEDVRIRLGSDCLPIGDRKGAIWVGRQDENDSVPFSMPGLEDLILGRDFLTRHGLLVLIDGEAKIVSLLLANDEDNRRRRSLARAAFDPGVPPAR